MESLDDIIRKRRSWAVMMGLLTPYVAPQNTHMLKAEAWKRVKNQTAV